MRFEDIQSLETMKHIIMCWMMRYRYDYMDSKYQENMSSRFSRNYEAHASEFLENIENIFTPYLIVISGS